MANTKITKAKENKCPLCECDVNGNQWREHLMICNGGRFPCNICGKLFKKSVYLIRHKKKFHEQNTEKVEAVDKSKEEDEERESWFEQDPGEVIRETLSLSESSDSSDDEDDDVVAEKKGENIGVCDEPRQSQKEVKNTEKREDVKGVKIPSPEKGRIIRKVTAPAPVFAPKRKMPISLPEIPEPIKKFSFKSKDTKGTQTAGGENRILKKRTIHRIVSNYVQDNKKIEETLEEEEFVYED